MPSSNFGHLMSILTTVCAISPESLLEVGVGFGKYGFLLRELLDLRSGEDGGYAPWVARIDGIEICENYLTPVHKYIYSNIYIGNAMDVLDKLETYYDCFLAVDVLEHFRKDDAHIFLQKAQRCAKNVIICTPYVYYDQGEIYNNPFEVHYSAWTIADLRALGARYIWKSGIGLVAVFSEEDYPFPSQIQDSFSGKDLNNMRLALDMYINSGQISESIALTEVYISKCPDDIMILTLAALCCEKAGLRGKALDYAMKILDIDPENESAKRVAKRLGSF